MGKCVANWKAAYVQPTPGHITIQFWAQFVRRTCAGMVSGVWVIHHTIYARQVTKTVQIYLYLQQYAVSLYYYERTWLIRQLEPIWWSIKRQNIRMQAFFAIASVDDQLKEKSGRSFAVDRFNNCPTARELFVVHRICCVCAAVYGWLCIFLYYMNHV